MLLRVEREASGEDEGEDSVDDCDVDLGRDDGRDCLLRAVVHWRLGVSEQISRSSGVMGV